MARMLVGLLRLVTAREPRVTMAHDRAWFETVEEQHPVDAVLFGTLGAITAEMLADLSHELVGKRYEFMDVGKFQALDRPSIMSFFYWREMLFRVHWAASLNMMRHQRWQVGCVRAFKAPANLLSFAASLRGMVEAALDANYSLGPVLYFLADNRAEIETALQGKLQALSTCEDLENRLIHYVYARKVNKDERDLIPDSHLALEPKDYRNAEGLPQSAREGFRRLYDELCGICHPTAYSLALLWSEKQSGDTTIARITSGDDELRIRNLCLDHSDSISLAMSISVTASALCLKALNRFSIPEVKCPSIERWSFDDIPAWKKAADGLSERTSN